MYCKIPEQKHFLDVGFALVALACLQVPYWFLHATFMHPGESCTKVKNSLVTNRKEKKQKTFCRMKRKRRVTTTTIEIKDILKGIVVHILINVRAH